MARRCQAIIIEDRALALAVGEGGAVGGTREVDKKGLVALDHGVAFDGDGHGLGVDAGRKTERTRFCCVVVASRRGRSVGGPVIEAEGRPVAAGTRDRKYKGLCAVSPTTPSASSMM